MTVAPPVERGLPRFYRWFWRHNVRDLVPTPLTDARIAVRRRATRIHIAGLAMIGVAVFGGTLWTVLVGPPRPGAALARVGFCLLGLLLTAVVTIGYERRADRQIATAHGQPLLAVSGPGAGTILGQGYVVLICVYCGGMLLGTAGGFLFDQAQDRLLALAFSSGLGLFVGFGAWFALDLLRRPATGADQRSRRVDQLLQQLDAHRYLRVLAVVPALLALPFSDAGLSDNWFVFRSYSVIAAGLAGIVMAVDHSHRHLSLHR